MSNNNENWAVQFQVNADALSVNEDKRGNANRILNTRGFSIENKMRSDKKCLFVEL